MDVLWGRRSAPTDGTHPVKYNVKEAASARGTQSFVLWCESLSGVDMQLKKDVSYNTEEIHLGGVGDIQARFSFLGKQVSTQGDIFEVHVFLV